MRRLVAVSLLTVCGLVVSSPPASAAPLTLGPVHVASGLSPFAPGCGGPGEASAGSVNYLNAEVEPHLADDPTDASTLAGAWQQDRWNDGGAHGNVHAYSHDGGATWTTSSPHVLPVRRWHRDQRGSGDHVGAAAQRLPAGHRPVGVLRPDRPAARDRDGVRQLHPPERDPDRLLRR